MILNTGNRTDIPAFFSEWFLNRIKEGFVCVRNPYYPLQVLRYDLSPENIDLINFCTKNPIPMLEHLDKLKDYRLLWYVTITPYDKNIEPHVPDKNKIIRAFQVLSKKLSSKQVIWRYDPIFLNEKYTLEYHIHIFEEMCKRLTGYTEICVISFIDLYEKTKRNFKGVKSVPMDLQHTITKAFVDIGKKYHISIYTCHEDESLKNDGAIISGCMSPSVIEKALDIKLIAPHTNKARNGCNCLLNHDIGVYNTCLHGCLYCYANYDLKTVLNNYKEHNKKSPFLIGDYRDDDLIKDVKMTSLINKQISLFD